MDDATKGVIMMYDVGKYLRLKIEDITRVKIQKEERQKRRLRHPLINM